MYKAMTVYYLSSYIWQQEFGEPCGIWTEFDKIMPVLCSWARKLTSALKEDYTE